MTRETRDFYYLGASQNLPELERKVNFLLARIGDRLDIIEGLRPDLSAGYYQLSTGKAISTGDPTATLGGMASQDPDSVIITGGSISLSDSYGTVIHSMGA